MEAVSTHAQRDLKPNSTRRGPGESALEPPGRRRAATPTHLVGVLLGDDLYIAIGIRICLQTRESGRERRSQEQRESAREASRGSREQVSANPYSRVRRFGRRTLARELATMGKLPTRYWIPSALQSSSVLPTHATSVELAHVQQSASCAERDRRQVF